MNASFLRYVEDAHMAYEQLRAFTPLHIMSLPKGLPKQCIYLFSERENHLYIGRTNNFRNRLRQHSVDGAQHNRAVFAFKLAREATGKTKASYKPKGSRAGLLKEPGFAEAFSEAKERIRRMDLRYVEETGQIRQTLLEIYVAAVLETPYNTFNTS